MITVSKSCKETERKKDMKFHVYKVEKVDDFINNATSISHDYTVDFNYYLNLRGYVKVDYYITDTPDLKIGHVYCCGKFLIKVLEHVAEFENEPRIIKPLSNFKSNK